MKYHLKILIASNKKAKLFSNHIIFDIDAEVFKELKSLHRVQC
jgi:hypothetical protein